MKITLRRYGINGMEIVYEAFNVHVVEDVVAPVSIKGDDGVVRAVGHDVRKDELEMFMDITAQLLKARKGHVDCEELIEAIAEREHRNMGMREVQDV